MRRDVVLVAVRHDVAVWDNFAVAFLRANDSGSGVWKMITTKPVGVEANGDVDELAEFGGFFHVGIYAGFEGFENFAFID